MVALLMLVPATVGVGVGDAFLLPKLSRPLITAKKTTTTTRPKTNEIILLKLSI